ncbi:MAG: hypothetical protein H6557_29150 [Lewinellaceae bacterium]|nr:hypothetical protein [Lewinellaceae bacterium]
MAKPKFFFSTLFFSACLFSFYPSSGQAHLQDELSAYCAEIYKKHNRPHI